MKSKKMAKPTTSITAISVAQFDESGEGMWLMGTTLDSDLTKEQAERLFLDRVEESVKYFLGEDVKFAKRKAYNDDDIEVKFESDTAKIYYGDITQHIRITYNVLKD